ncbi:hypothetical protein C9374_013187 [Naegleria lovaniensis]|uniref:Uncharacterized protein n=1 Tax=Naegleria lovaniensis TaxID=51637 RepID=A0AA88G5M6_NAELO|nr:uncharacterized protein C9374_013187 [Naegleria lovaniensis]KAG2372735.1 hypothetical protein C9374_013187 [Naegleria lovaniensis]
MLDTNYGDRVIVNSELCDAHKKVDVDSADIIANSVHMKELRRLRLTTKFGDDLIRALCDSEYIKKLDSIILQSCNLSKNGIIMLSNCASMNNLTELEVLYTFGEEGLAAIANSTVLRNLRVLNLSAKIFQHWNANACRIGKTGAKLLSKSSYLTNITKLDLENNNIEDEGVLSICESEFSRNITHLNLASNGITENGISFLTKLTSKMVHLITLHLDLNYITLHGAKMIASSRVMQHLKAISFLKCYIGDEGIVDICNSEFLKNLTSLIVDSDTISEKGARMLSMASILKLKSLSLPSCNIENNGLIVMANSSALCQLTHLDVGFNDISSEGIQAICNSPYWKNLSFLSLRNISLSDDDVELIGRTLHNLHELHTSISTSQLESLSKLLPYCEINNWVTLLDVD